MDEYERERIPDDEISDEGLIIYNNGYRKGEAKAYWRIVEAYRKKYPDDLETQRRLHEIFKEINEGNENK